MVREGTKSPSKSPLSSLVPSGSFELQPSRGGVLGTAWGAANQAPSGERQGPRINASITCRQSITSPPFCPFTAYPWQPTQGPNFPAPHLQHIAPAQVPTSLSSPQLRSSGCALFILLFSLTMFPLCRTLDKYEFQWLNKFHQKDTLLFIYCPQESVSHQQCIKIPISPHFHLYLLLSILIQLFQWV